MSDQDDRLPDKTVDPAPADPMAILESRMQIGDGRNLLVRSVRPDDDDRLREAFRQLSDDTILNRFFYSRKPLSRKSAHDRTHSRKRPRSG